MKFFMPTEVFIGKNVIEENKEKFREIGKKALIVTGRSSSKKNGSLEAIEKTLKEMNIEYLVYDKVEENPTVETVVLAGEIGRKENVDFIVGIGGGSPIDASKAIGVYILNKNLTKETLFTSEKLKSIPIVAVPTTAGTGTETTQYAILTDHVEKTKKNLGQEIFPVLSLVDPTFMMGMSIGITRNTAIDAFSHVVEGYLNTNANKISDGLAETALKEFSKTIEGLKKGTLSYEDRESLAIVSNIAGIIIAQTGTSIPHGLGYSLTYYKNVPHGLANGCLYKEYLKVFKNREKVNKIYELLGFEVEELDELLESFCTVHIDITEEEIKAWSKAFTNNKAKLKNHPEEITEEDIVRIYKNSLLK